MRDDRFFVGTVIPWDGKLVVTSWQGSYIDRDEQAEYAILVTKEVGVQALERARKAFPEFEFNLFEAVIQP